MKTTLEIPDAVFRRAKAAAAERGIPLREFVTEALKDKLAGSRRDRDKPWMTGVGGLRHQHRETARISRIIEEEFEQIEAEDRL